VLHCRSDADAVSLVERRRNGQPMELWQEDRMVQSFPMMVHAAE
jgi:hypothetical protein